HFFGCKDDELTVRWTQFGVFAPITRLHSSDGPFNTREPWRYGERARRVMTSFLRLRHRLVPYLYTMNRRAHVDGEPLVQPMYYAHPDDADAYRVRNQYLFGDRLLVAPITTPADRATGLGSVRAWLPPGRWTDVFTGVTYRGGTTILLHRDLDTIPVLAPAGAILPLAADAQQGVANPEALELRVYAGADGEFTLAEDQDDERWALTRFTLTGDELRIHPVEGEHGSVPATRRYDVVLCGFAGVTAVEVDGIEQPTVPGPVPDGVVRRGPTDRGDPTAVLPSRNVPGSVSVHLPSVAAAEGAVLRLVGDSAAAGNRDIPERLFALLDAAQIELSTKDRVHWAVTTHEPARAVPALAALDLPQPLFTAVVELLLADYG
ncbi:MAG TPA: TIM-barrel domain-containing protein, partial [Pseudonocardia sp.]|nr:TIM-barrel domain-containing protein [Pseudonocardia sp.]